MKLHKIRMNIQGISACASKIIFPHKAKVQILIRPWAVLLLFICFSPFLVKTQNIIPHEINSKEKVGWIEYNPERDDPSFKVCDELNIQEYYQVNPKFKEGLKSIKEFFKTECLDLDFTGSFSGYLTARFVINCEGETGRFWFFIVDSEYRSINLNFDSTGLQKSIIRMGKWEPGKFEGKIYDSYKHLVFKIIGGKVTEIIA